jgi:hypothetical protein
VKGKGIPVTGHEGPLGCETLRVLHYLDNRLTDGSKVVSLTRRQPFTPRGTWYSFLLEAESTPGPIEKNPPHRDWKPRPSGL